MSLRHSSVSSRSAPRRRQSSSPLHGWEVALVVLAVASLLLFATARTMGARASSRTGFFSRTARPAMAFWGEPVDVELLLDAQKLPTCGVVADVEPIYAALVIDHSGSMDGPPLVEARNAASDFVDLMNLTKEGDAVAVVMFDEVANLLNSFSQDRAAVVRNIQRIPGGGSTDIAGGLAVAAQQFSLKPPPADARQVIVLLSDGKQEAPGDPIAAANGAKAQGLRVVTIALGDADRDILAQMASSEADYYETADPAALMEIYSNIAAGMVGTAATDIALEEYFNDTHFDLIEPGLYRAQWSGNRITWQLPFVGQRGRSVGYVLRPTALGWHQVSPPGQVSLTDCNEQPLSQATPIGPRVLVLFPVWLLYIFPALALLWAIYRLLQAMRRPPPEAMTRPDVKRPPVDRGRPAEKKRAKETGADVTHGRPKKR